MSLEGCSRRPVGWCCVLLISKKTMIEEVVIKTEVEGFFEFLPSSWLSAKFLAFLPSLWHVCQVVVPHKVSRVSAKFVALSAKVVGPSWQKIANAKLLHTPMMEFEDFVLSCSKLAIFC